MTRRFIDRLDRWLARHPLKRPPTSLQARYVQEVMARISAGLAPRRASWLQQAASALAPWLSAPRLAMGLAGLLVLLGVGAMFARMQQPARLAREIDHHAHVLAQLQEEPAVEEVVSPADEGFAGELRAMDHRMLAEESAMTDRQWIDQALELLNSLEEPVADTGGADQDEWLRELEQLDHAQLPSSPS